MALGKNVKKDKLIPSKEEKEKSAKPQASAKAVKKTKPKASSPAPKGKKVPKKAAKKVVKKTTKLVPEQKVAPKQPEKTASPEVSAPPVAPVIPPTPAVPEVEEPTVEPMMVAAPVQHAPQVAAVEMTQPVAAPPRRIQQVKYLTQEQIENRKRLKAKYDQDILKLRGQAVQLIVFHLGNDRYALEIDKVKEIVAVPAVSRLPHAPPYMKGVANIRGSVMVIMDLEEKFELLRANEIKEKAFTLVIKNDKFKAGILVSEVPTTLKVQGDIIASSSGIMSNTVLDETYIKGLIKKEDGMIILLDIIELIESDEVKGIVESIEYDS